MQKFHDTAVPRIGGLGLLIGLFTGYCIDRVGVWGLDSLLAWAPICALFTAFAVAVAANAYNIIDGFHGLTSAAMVMAVAAMSAIAYEVGDTELLGNPPLFKGTQK